MIRKLDIAILGALLFVVVAQSIQMDTLRKRIAVLEQLATRPQNAIEHSTTLDHITKGQQYLVRFKIYDWKSGLPIRGAIPRCALSRDAGEYVRSVNTPKENPPEYQLLLSSAETNADILVMTCESDAPNSIRYDAIYTPEPQLPASR